jgi:hypothetical protein
MLTDLHDTRLRKFQSDVLVVVVILGIYKSRVINKIDNNKPRRGRNMSRSRFR